MSAYREPEAREESPLVDRVRSDEEWRLMKSIAVEECHGRRVLARVAILAIGSLVVGATCLATAEFFTVGRLVSAITFLVAFVTFVILVCQAHVDHDSRAADLVRASFDLQRERSR